MRGQETAVQATLVAPDRVVNDATHSDREVFYRKGVVAGAERYFLKVCIEFRRTVDGVMVGEVVTAYPANRFKSGERQRWP